MTKVFVLLSLILKIEIEIKHIKKHIGILLLVIFLLPMTILSLHAFSGHEHAVCNSKIEKHLHEKDFDCKIDFIKQLTPFLAINTFKLDAKVLVNTATNLEYNFLKNHYQLSFSLRGPPVCI